MSEHPSYFALDRLALGETAPEVEAHVAGCARCQSHLEAVRVRVPVPAWVGGIERKRPPWRRWAPALAAAAVVAVLALRIPAASYVGVKGPAAEPMVHVLVKRGAEVAAWDGAPLRPGDAIRLALTPLGYARVRVETPAGDGLLLLYAGALPAEPQVVLPKSWTIDAEGSREILIITLLGESNENVWKTRITLPKRP